MDTSLYYNCELKLTLKNSFKEVEIYALCRVLNGSSLGVYHHHRIEYLPFIDVIPRKVESHFKRLLHDSCEVVCSAEVVDYPFSTPCSCDATPKSIIADLETTLINYLFYAN